MYLCDGSALQRGGEFQVRWVRSQQRGTDSIGMVNFLGSYIQATEGLTDFYKSVGQFPLPSHKFRVDGLEVGLIRQSQESITSKKLLVLGSGELQLKEIIRT